MPPVKSLLTQYSLVQLYTDKVPPQYQPTTSADENRRLLNERFGTAQLPLYVILKPEGNGKYAEVARYEEGKINNVGAFLEFLRKPLDAIASNGSVAREETNAGGAGRLARRGP
jgi:hypothetical protein